MKDVLIIGAGPGGFDAALYAAKNGLSVTLIEAQNVGGTCLNWGCIPTKALYQNAKVIHQIDNAKTFGVITEQPRLDFEIIKDRKESIVSQQIKNIHTSLKRLDVELIEGKAQFVDEHTVRVNHETYQAKHIMIATGSKPKKLTFNGDDLDIIKGSKELLDLEVFPKKLLVVGAGVIGTEMAQIFQAFGAEVTIIDFQDDILMTEDHEIRKRAKNLFKRSGLTIHTNASLQEVLQKDKHYTARFKTPKETVEVEVDYVLMAVGRQPNFGDLDLDLIGVNHDGYKILVNDNKQTNLSHIYAIGDVNNEFLLAHKASYDGYRAVNSILNKKDTIRFDLVPSVIFTNPLIASVGVKEEDLESDYTTTKALFKANAKAVAMDDSEGFVKLIFDKDNTLIGAHIIGNSADTLIHELTAMIQKGFKIAEVHDMIHAHPTVSEVIHDAIRQIH